MGEMKILFCSPNPLVKELGAPKVLIELAEALSNLGWTCDLIGPPELVDRPFLHLIGEPFRVRYVEGLRNYLHQYASDYQVIDYDHIYLPFPRQEFDPKPLFVARSVLLAHYLETIPLPKEKDWKSQLRQWLKGSADVAENNSMVARAKRTVQEADLVNVSNHYDKVELVRQGICPEKVMVLPYGMSVQRRSLFDDISTELPSNPVVVFIGTFDPRKGSTDFPHILVGIHQQIPNVNFLLLGTNKSEQKVLSKFPRYLANRIQVIPQYSSSQLSDLLKSCSVGIFPSYFEGFPFGVIEMLAAAIPVIAYDSPGAPMMLLPDYLVSTGDTEAMSQKVVDLLNDRQKLSAARQWAKQQAKQFDWQQVAEQTSQIYLKHCENR